MGCFPLSHSVDNLETNVTELGAHRLFHLGELSSQQMQLFLFPRFWSYSHRNVWPFPDSFTFFFNISARNLSLGPHTCISNALAC